MGQSMKVKLTPAKGFTAAIIIENVVSVVFLDGGKIQISTRNESGTIQQMDYSAKDWTAIVYD